MPKTKLTDKQLREFCTATNRVSLESIKYAADIVGHTDLATATVAVLEKLTENGSANVYADGSNLRVLYQRAAKSTLAAEPLLDAILTALRWATSEGTGGFAVGNIVDPIYHTRFQRKEEHDDEEVYQRLEEIRRQCLTPYYEQLKSEQGTQNA